MVNYGTYVTSNMPTVWIDYNSDNTSSATLTYPSQWYTMADDTTSTTTTYNYCPKTLGDWGKKDIPITEAEREASRKRQRELAATLKREKEQREHAKKVAEELLLENMTPEQMEMWKKTKNFHIIGADGERYELDTRRQWHNIYRLNAEGRKVEEFCIYQTGRTPLGDNHLMQKLIIEADTELLRRVANSRILA